MPFYLSSGPLTTPGAVSIRSKHPEWHAIIEGCGPLMNSPELSDEASHLEKLIDYHRLLRIVKEECRNELDEDSIARLTTLILDRIQRLELPAALQLDRAREAR